MSGYNTSAIDHRGVEIGGTFIHPDVRGSAVNAEMKLLMIDHAFVSGAIRVQLRVDARNERSQAAVAKLGATREGVLRRDMVTWTGHMRDTVVFSILSDEWPPLKRRLEERVARASLRPGL
jgi:RimJ/RimL family protein N-acetyltransferase